MKRLLIANRGEIAVRVIRSAREAGYATAAVYADQDIAAMHVRLADEAVGLQGTAPAETYLHTEKILAAAKRLEADGVHPGYGFLSEDADFACAVLDAGLTWVGPSPETIEKLGNKMTAREIARAAGAPLVPATEGPVRDAHQVRQFAHQHGFPIVIKAAHGGGGRGMRIVHREEELEASYASAVHEAETAFGRGECFVEKFLQRPRHIEAQVIADHHGRVIVVGTRDCSLQRRNQKLVEEAPAPFLEEDVRLRIHDSARTICTRAGYTGAGTVEYLLSPDGVLTFLEVNTRLQVEHPVTEETTGIDLVAEQLRIAEGLPLSMTEDPQPLGHSLEFRLNAEDPALGFLPTPGRIEAFHPPTGPGIRLDTSVHAGDEVSGAFDSMFAKLIVTGTSRHHALKRAYTALEEMRIEGIPTVVPFHQAVLQAQDFRAEVDGRPSAERFRVHTRWIETDFSAELEHSEYLAASVRHRQGALRRVPVEIDGRSVELGIPVSLLEAMGSIGAPWAHKHEGSEKEGAVAVPYAVTLVRWQVNEQEQVTEGQGVAVVEAMKMESTVAAPQSGIFRRAQLYPGDVVAAGEHLGVIG